MLDALTTTCVFLVLLREGGLRSLGPTQPTQAFITTARAALRV